MGSYIGWALVDNGVQEGAAGARSARLLLLLWANPNGVPGEAHRIHVNNSNPDFACVCAQLLPQSRLGVDVFIGNVADDAIAFGARVRLDVDGLITTQ